MKNRHFKEMFLVTLMCMGKHVVSLANRIKGHRSVME